MSGTPPEDLLDRPLVTQIAGDRIAGFYIPRLEAERDDAAPTPFAPRRPNAPKLAGYSWGGLTSGSPARALWLILLPFTLMNVAPRARPAGRAANSSSVRLIWYVARVLALTLTCLYVITGVGVGEDLVGWQCAGSAGKPCAAAAPGWLFRGLSYEHRLSAEHMLLLGALVPLAQLLVMWATSSRTANRYESTVADLGTNRGAVTVDHHADRNATELPLSSALMWRNAQQVRRLRAVHMQVGIALVLWTVLGATEGPRDHWYQLSGHWWSLVPLAVLGYALVGLGAASFTGHGTSAGWKYGSWAVWSALAVAGGYQAMGLLFAHDWLDGGFLGQLIVPGGPRQREPALISRVTEGSLPYYPATLLLVCGIALTVLAVLIVVVLAARIADRAARTPDGGSGDHQPLPPPLIGIATAVFATLAVFLAAAFSAGTYMFAASWLNTGSVKPGFGQVAQVYDHFVVPATVGTANLAYVFAVAALSIVIIVAVGVVGVRFRWAAGGRLQMTRDYPQPTDGSDPERSRRDRAIRQAMFLGRLVDQAQWFLAALVVIGLTIVTTFAVALLANDAHAPDQVFDGVDKGWLSASALGGAGAYLAVMTVIGLVTVGALAFRVPTTRRSVGILWDVAAFWPRACHPLAAPCYAERTVPDLVTFITAHRVRHPDDVLVLSAHSQGSVISAATLLQLDTFDTLPKTGFTRSADDASPIDVVPRICFLSFGCVLRRLYGRFFPVYFGPRELHRLEVVLGGGTAAGHEDGDSHAALPRWRNLWRYTDYLGGQVTAGPPQRIPTTAATMAEPGVAPDAPAVRGPVAWEWHSPDPSSFGRQPGDTTFSVAHRHSDYWKDESGYFQLAVADLAAQTMQPDEVKPT